MARYRVYFVLVSLLLLTLFLQYRLWFQAGGMMDMVRLKKALVRQNKANEKLKEENEALLVSIQYLRENQDVNETHARKELGMIKKGETFYQVVR